ncbi:MAG: PilZ domain-containing protein [Treponema sp.]|jgi:hypothetical protein|nr:PilZ domain-containing protein [Treponema sp.]
MNFFPLQEQIKYFKEDDPVAGMILLAGLGTVLIAFFAGSLVKNRIKEKKRTGRSARAPRRFSSFALRRTARNYGLNRGQTKMLEYVLKNGGAADPEQTVANPSALDKQFKHAFKLIEENAGTEEEAQQKLSMLFSTRNTIDMRHNTSPAAPSTQQISINMAAVLTVNQESYPVKVISSKGDTVLVDCPRGGRGTMLRFSKGTRANLGFYTKTNKGFSFDSRVMGMTSTSFGPALQLIRAHEATSLTQRRFRRQPANFPCDFHTIRLEPQKKKKLPPRMILNPQRMSGIFTDISIGGCAIKTRASVSAGARLKIEFDFTAVLGQVLRINRNGVSGTVLHVKFLKVPRKAMNRINSLVFEYDHD